MFVKMRCGELFSKKKEESVELNEVIKVRCLNNKFKSL